MPSPYGALQRSSFGSFSPALTHRANVCHASGADWLPKRRFARRDDGGAGLIESRDQAFGGFGVVTVIVAEGLNQGGFFNVDAIEERRSGGDCGDGEAEPVAGMHADGKERQPKAEIRRMADEAIDAGAIELLRIENSDV